MILRIECISKWKKMKKTTLREVAQISGYSISTVSKALSNSPEIGKVTKEKIRAIAKTYHYTPNRMAQCLKKNKSGTIGVVFPRLKGTFFNEVYRGIASVTSMEGYNIISTNSMESVKTEVRALQMLNSGAVDGLLISVASESQGKKNFDHIDAVLNNQIPMVFFDRVENDINADKVIIDDMDSAKGATLHLIRTGCKRIVATSSIPKSSIAQERLNGMKLALGLHHCDNSEDLFFPLSDDKPTPEVLVHKLRKGNIDGILALDELASMWSHEIIESVGKSMPEEVSLIGYTNGLVSKYLSPSLTVVEQHGFEMGKSSVQLLMKRIKQNSIGPPYAKKVIKSNLIIRNSTKKMESSIFEGVR